MVELKKEGPIYSVAWSPKGDVFAVVYGFMPARTSLFNNKGDAGIQYILGFPIEIPLRRIAVELQGKLLGSIY